jgi:DNA-binding Lrp family transcriptional regulator
MILHPARALSPIAVELINAYQGGLPLNEKPFATIAEQLSCTEQQVVDTLAKLLHDRWLTRFGPLYDASALGGGLTLAAVSADEAHYDAIAEIINQYPQVAHNYRREHELNMWFVIATETQDEVGVTIDQIEDKTGLKVYNFPKQNEYYVGLWLRIDNGRINTVPVPRLSSAPMAYHEEPVDRSLIQLTQAGIPLTTTPWQHIASKAGTSIEYVLQRMQYMLDTGIIRRIGMVPNHYKLGLRANGMTVWNVNDDMIDTIGNSIGQLDFVSHCYHRPRYLPVWRYNLFAMVHGHDQREVENKKSQIEKMIGSHCTDHDVLYSSQILKKAGLRLAA